MQEIIERDESHFGEGGEEVRSIKYDEVVEESLTHEDGDAARHCDDEDNANHISSAADESVDKATFAGAVDNGNDDRADQEPEGSFVEPPVAERGAG